MVAQNRVTSANYTTEYFQLEISRYTKKDSFYKNRLNRVLPYLNVHSNEIIVDLGCGMGTFSVNIAKQVKQVYAIDYSQEALVIVEKIAKQLGLTNITTIKNSIDSIELPNDSVDKIVSADLVEHLYPEQFTGAINESRRILKPGGLICIYTPNPPSFIKKVLRVFYRPIKLLIENRHKESNNTTDYLKKHSEKYEYLHVDYKTPKVIMNTLTDYGFKTIKSTYFEIPGPSFLRRNQFFAKNFGRRTLIVAIKIR